MSMRGRKLCFLLVAVALITDLGLSFSCANAQTPKITWFTPRAAQSSQAPTFVNASFNENEIFIFDSGNLQINFASDAGGNVNVVLTSDGTAFPASSEVSASFNQGITQVQVPLTANLNALPGTYTIHVTVEYVNVSHGNNLDAILTGDVTVHLGLGFIVGLSLIVGLACAVVIYAVKRSSSIPASTAEPTPVSGASENANPKAATAPPNKIRCPECKKTIGEGSVFCPECGFRIPEFLRTNPNATES
jgi:hypothetical protein